MKERINTIWTALLGSILSLLGFSSCYPRAEYGAPHANYKIIAEATDNGQPVEGIRVAIGWDGLDGWMPNDTLYTGADGKASVEDKYEMRSGNIQIKFEDVDGEKNGLYKTVLLTNDDLDEQKTGEGDGKWFFGDYTITAKANLEKDE